VVAAQLLVKYNAIAAFGSTTIETMGALAFAGGLSDEVTGEVIGRVTPFALDSSGKVVGAVREGTPPLRNSGVSVGRVAGVTVAPHRNPSQ